MAKLSIGDKFPDFSLHTAQGETLSTSEVVQRQPKTIFWVLRYIGCTVCRYDVHVISQRYQEFLDQGTQVLVVLQSQPETVREDTKTEPIPIEIICDPDLEIYGRLSIEAAADLDGLRPSDPSEVEKFAQKKEASTAAGFAHGKYEGNEYQLPALFITDKEGTLTYVHYARNIMDMPTVDELLSLPLPQRR